MLQNYINHIVFVIDRSGSMSALSNEVVKVFDAQIKNLARRSQELDQETRVSVYLFDSTVECLIYDKDVLRLPSLSKHYSVRGQTSLIDGTLKALEDLQKTPELYGDHAFLTYVLTDGEENASRNSPSTIVEKLKKLPENWTVAVLVPDQRGIFEAKKFGFAADNIQVWSTNTAGLNEVGNVITKATDAFMKNRSSGVRSTKSLFTIDASALKSSEIQKKLNELSEGSDYELLNISRESPIKDFVESWIKEPYRKGSAYYQLTKPETIQNHKQICIQNKRNGKVFYGPNARNMLGLPNVEIRVNPVSFSEFDLYVQSTSANRKLVPGTKLLVLK